MKTRFVLTILVVLSLFASTVWSQDATPTPKKDKAKTTKVDQKKAAVEKKDAKAPKVKKAPKTKKAPKAPKVKKDTKTTKTDVAKKDKTTKKLKKDAKPDVKAPAK